MSERSMGTSDGLLWRLLRWWLGLDRPRRTVQSVPASDGRGPARTAARLESRLDEIARRLDELAERLAPLQAGAGSDSGDGSVYSALASLEKQVSRLGREQLRANALAEAQAEQLSSALEVVRAADARREAELSASREQGLAAQSTARLEVVRAVLPALDGLDEALRTGRHLLDRAATSSPAPGGRRFWRRRVDSASDEREPVALREAMDAWLVGIGFVRERLLEVLGAEGVRPIEAEGQPFDPERHLAVEVVPASKRLPPATVAAEIRRGYLVDGRVLRHAEVAVSRREG